MGVLQAFPHGIRPTGVNMT